ncbi:MAG: hypothetical protein JWM10_644 [Myxococcaceae bacterium]|nr:hypothetical protein [Myxococcaceae bacterium]
MNDEKGRKLLAASLAAMAGRPLPVGELARRVGCTPREAVEVVLRFDTAALVTVAPADDESDFVVRPSRPPG